MSENYVIPCPCGLTVRTPDAITTCSDQDKGPGCGRFLIVESHRGRKLVTPIEFDLVPQPTCRGVKL